MKTGRIFLFALIFAAGFAFRVYDLDRRPMHHDEANQAVKFLRLWEEGRYQYDPADHHGPSLYYLTLPAAWISGSRNAADIDETVIRWVPAFFGTALILLMAALGRFSGHAVWIWAAGFAAFSPVMTYYSRFYIQEILLVFFILGFLYTFWRLLSRPRMRTALFCGVFAGMMYATKETSVIAFGAAAAAFLGLRVLDSRFSRQNPLPSWKYWLAAGAAGAAAAFAFFTSFFTHWRGPLDSILAFQSYLGKAGGPDLHAHPWDYYLDMLFYSRYGQGPAWTEALILILALTGGIAAWMRNPPAGKDMRFFRFISLFTLVMTAAYSFIPYKTPWNILPFYLGFLLLSGYGAAVLFRRMPRKPVKAAAGILLAAGMLHLGWQSRQANFVYPANPRNPYVYAHTSPDFLKLTDRIRSLSRVHSKERDMLIMVAAGPYHTWPLPWYLRAYSRVGYWTDIRNAPLEAGPAVLITPPDMNDFLPEKIKDEYITEFYGLRPEVFLTIHIEKSLWDKFIRERK